VPACYITGGGQLRLGRNTTINTIVKLTGLWIDGKPVDTHPHTQWQAATLEAKSGGYSNGSSPLLRSPLRETVGESMIEVQTDVTMSVTIGGQIVAATVPLTPPRLSAKVTTVHEPTGNYITDEISLAARSWRVGIWIERANQNSNQRHLVFGVFAALPISEYRFWLRYEGKVVPFEPHTSAWSSHHARYRWTIDDLIAQHPELARSQHIDMIIRPDIQHAETAAGKMPIWLGEWVFEDVPLDAAPVPEIPQYPKDQLPTLVPAQTRALTLEEAEKPPSP